MVLVAGCASGDETATPRTLTLPPVAPFDYQLGGDGQLPQGVQMVARDWQDGAAAGGDIYDVCYVNAFQSQPGVEWPEELVSDVEDPEWPGEFVIDLSTAGNRSLAAGSVEKMVERCAAAGFDAVEFDNLDTFSRYERLAFGRAETIEYATTIVGLAHVRGLAVAQKNTVELLDTHIGFDFAVTEQCGEYDECGEFTAVYGDLVFDIEYSESGFAAACAFFADAPTVIRRDLDLAPEGAEGHRYERCHSALAAG